MATAERWGSAPDPAKGHGPWNPSLKRTEVPSAFSSRGSGAAGGGDFHFDRFYPAFGAGRHVRAAAGVGADEQGLAADAAQHAGVGAAAFAYRDGLVYSAAFEDAGDVALARAAEPDGALGVEADAVREHLRHGREDASVGEVAV